MGYFKEQHQIQRIEECRQEMNRRIISPRYEGQSKWPEEAIIEKLKKEAQKWKSSH